MATTMRIIKTGSIISGRTYIAYAFMLRPAERALTNMLQLELMDPDGPHVMQSDYDPGGLLVYPGDTAPPQMEFCQAVVKIFNRVLDTDYVVAEDSFVRVRSYGITAGGKSYEELLREDQFRLPYMTAQS
jgi:hypothetical protein